MAEQQPIFSLKGPVMESAKALTMVFIVTGGTDGTGWTDGTVVKSVL